MFLRTDLDREMSSLAIHCATRFWISQLMRDAATSDLWWDRYNRARSKIVAPDPVVQFLIYGMTNFREGQTDMVGLREVIEETLTGESRRIWEAYGNLMPLGDDRGTAG